LAARPALFALLAVAWLLATCAFASPALATRTHIFDFAFGAGELQGPQGIALNETSGNVYVVDPGAPQIDEYNESGTPLSQFDGAAAPTGPLEAPKDIAVDNSKNPLDPSEGDVYVSGEVKVAGEAVHVIYKFSEGGTYLGQITAGSAGAPFGELFGVAVDPSGQLWAYQEDKEIDHYSNALENELEGSCEVPREGASPGLAVDSEENLYVNTPNKRFTKLSSNCAELIFEVDESPQHSSAAALDTSSNEVFLDNITSAARFSAEAELIYRFGAEETLPAGDLQEGAGIAVNGASAKKLVYIADHGANEVKVYEEAVRPTVQTLPATDLGPEKATLNGTVNPEGVQVSSCVFEYGESSAYGQSVPCQPSPGAGEEPVAVSAKPAGLEAGKTYHYRVRATNTSNLSSAGEDQSFTLGPGIEAASVSDVSADAASFSATINPHQVSTGAFFQYGPTTAYGSNVPAAPTALGEGEGPVAVGPEHVQGLSANSTYHYRVVAVQEGRQFPGPDQSFTTQGGGGALALPDGRAWELVSPPEKHGGVIEGPGGIAGLAQAAAHGGAVSYVANAPTEASPQGNPGPVQVLSTHGSAGWSSKDIASPHSRRATGKGASAPPEYTLFSEELSAGLIQPWGLFEQSLSEAASEQTPYIRTLGSCSANCFQPLLSAKPGHQNALPGFGEELLCDEEENSTEEVEVVCGPRFLGASPDLGHVVLLSAAPLTPGAGREELYEWSGGALSEVSLLPRNEAGEELPAREGQARFGAGLLSGGETVGAVKHAISADGRRVFWEAAAAPGATPTLYVRDSERHETLELDTAEAACVEEARCEDGGGRFQVASADGTRVLFSDSHRLSKGGNAEGDLYECEIAIEGEKLACQLTDLTPEAGGEARVQGSVLGASEDLATVYFVGLGALATAPNARGQSPLSGQPNLYVRRGGVTSFIATLAEGDKRNWEGRDEFQPARVSSDGRYLAFMSERSLSGYDNRDAVSGRPDAEVYEYDAQGGELSCVSCDPSGARPRGVEFGQLLEGESVLAHQANTWLGSGWVAALLPGSPSFTTGGAAYQTRSLSDSGRVFFDQLDPLVPQDVNGNWDVYEREPVGVGGCEPGAQGFEVTSESCLGMISSGSSARPSILLDSSKSGADVFFLTAEKLTSKDVDESRDVYDAHECAVGWSCPPEEAVVPPPCTTEASCRAAPSPQPQIFGAPASASFSGPGNPPPPPPVKPKPPTRHELLQKALASCHKRFAHSKAKRSSCERQARRKYGTVAKKKPAKKARKAKQGSKGGHR
jgi:hypothetical protein